YEYDLISGNVNKVSYQPGQPDQFHHRYEYDADNRIQSVSTSLDGLIWDRDASYKYYRHGPLARVELGDLQVQGMDYAYTLQGWIKAVNGFNDMGGDGTGNSQFSKDAFAYSLHYNRTDYKSINSATTFLDKVNNSGFAAIGNNATVPTAGAGLYNGNIAKMVTAVNGLDLQGKTYKYDQLNRLVASQTYEGDNLSRADGKYDTEYAYDANGNIQTLTRYGDNGKMDELTYRYAQYARNGKEYILNNRLLHVRDAVNAGAYSTDIDDQGAYAQNDPQMQNYEYDKIGNLIKDEKEKIAEIKWNVSGKVTEIIRTPNSSLSDLLFRYDAFGNRVSKTEIYPNAIESVKEVTTYYVRDAQGNVMATYNEKKYGDDKVDLALTEQHLYGSSRLGMRQVNELLIENDVEKEFDLDYSERILGQKNYELTNHLGNVLAVVSDKKLNDNMPDVVSTSDYYPFGMMMPGRFTKPEDYRFGFNAQEKVNEIAENHYTAPFWEYDPRAVMRWNRDPVIVASESPYAINRNNPILYNDPNGDCPDCKDGTYTIQEGDTFESLENKWEMKSGSLAGYNSGIDPKKLSTGQVINVSPTVSGSFKAGTGNPSITHDNGFAGFPKQSPTIKDRANYAYWYAKAKAAGVVTDLEDGVSAYLHYLDATGTDKNFSLQKFFDEDASGKAMRDNSIGAAKTAAEKLLPYAGQRDISMSVPFYVGGGSVDYPYPETENWQKAVGAFPFYMTGVVTAQEISGRIKYTLKLTIHAEDRYNFNPGQADIATGIPDDVNGRFEVVGFAKQYMHYGTYSTTKTWFK
uniref:RHS repeat domain-containing protein n=1 Tax=Bacteroides sp. UBA939 TaxID=1946092 RepID=UPI0025BCA0D8